jgi:glycosyltransferase involved in cell wall biosynthesis
MSIYITPLAPINETKNVKGLAQATVNFSHNLISAINPDFVYALLSISEKKKKKFSFEYGRTFLVQCRIFPQNRWFRLFNIIIENYIIIKNILINHENNIWFYNIDPHNFISYLILKFIFKKKCFIILADFSPDVAISKFFLKVMRKANGIVSFSYKTQELFLNHPNFEIKPGIINPKCIVCQDINTTNKKIYLFSGCLDYHTGIDLVLEVFSKLPEYNLIITGNGNAQYLIDNYIQKYDNIKYLGYLKYTEYLEVLKKADIVLNLRNPNFIENNYNFPSKIIEFFLNKKLLISTIKYIGIDENLYFYSDYNINALKNTIQIVIDSNNIELENKRNLSYNFATQNYSYESWDGVIKKIEQKAI